MPSQHVTGGHRVRAWLRRAKAARNSVHALEVGFYSTAKYQDGTPVTNVAAWNEFGAPRASIPERPFMRPAIEDSKDDIRKLLGSEIDRNRMVITQATAEKIGLLLQGAIQEKIVEVRVPANAPSTIAAKGSDNPLVDTGKLRTSVTYKTF